MTRPVLLLDVMGTLVRDPFYDVVPAFFDMTLERLIAEKHPTSWVDFEHGRIDAAGYYARMFADGRSIDVEAFETAVESSYEWIEGIEALLGRLSAQGVEMHALSNYPVWYRWIEARLELSRYLDWSFVSCNTGHRKPDPDAYLEAARALRREASDCLFVDDRRDNCHAAEAIGMPALLFTDAASLERTLVERGIVVSE